MHTSRLATNNVHESKAGSVCQNDAQESNKSNDAAAVHRTTISKHADRVNGDKKDGQEDKIEIIVDIVLESGVKALQCEHVDCCMH